jgi:hypothetical protein
MIASPHANASNNSVLVFIRGEANGGAVAPVRETNAKRSRLGGTGVGTAATLAIVLRRVLPLGLAGFLLACGGADAPGSAPATTAAASTANTANTATTATTASTANTANTAEPTGVLPVPDALQFSAPLVGGGEIELGALAGRPVLLWFWAPW